MCRARVSGEFKKKDVYKYTLRMPEGRVVDRALIDYVLLPKRMLGRLLDVKLWRGEKKVEECLTIFLLEARLKLVGGWRVWEIC